MSSHSYDPIKGPTSSVTHINRARNPKWKKIWAMFGALLLAVLLAVGHGIFYRWLNGRRLDHTLSQTWVTNIGTAFAFAFKLFLVIAIGIAFAQQQWHEMKQVPHEVGEVDKLSEMLNDIFVLFDVRLWPKLPVLVLIAAIGWIVPFAAIFPPGTLKVVLEPARHQQDLQVSQLQLINNTNFQTRQGSAGTNSYSDAAPVVYTAALAAATSGEILKVPHSQTNMTYDLQMYGPAIQCSNSSTNLTQLVESHINRTGSGGGYYYISFVGGDEHGLFNSSGLDCDDYGLCSRPVPAELDGTVPYDGLDTYSTDTARLYVMLGIGVLFECHLYNASYEMTFDFSSLDQDIALSKVDYLNPVATNISGNSPCYPSASDYYDLFAGGLQGCLEQSAIISYQAIMEAFGSMFVGAIWGKFSLPQRLQTLVQTLSIAPQWGDGSPTFSDDFQRAMEQMFHNVTLSMLAYEPLRQSNDASEVVPVSVTTYPPTYLFEPLRLYLAYGIATGITIFCVLIGLRAISMNGSTYSNKFSTYVRVATSVQHTVSPADGGAIPCPENIRTARLVLTSGRNQELDDL